MPCFCLPRAKTFFKTALSHLLRGVFILSGRDAFLPDAGATVMVVAPHPDDETLGCGATIARLRAGGVRVRLVIVTDGRSSTSSDLLSPQDLAGVRRTEAQKAAQALGIPETDIVFLAHPDRQAQARQARIEQDIAAQIWLCSPTLLLVPYGYDEHEDHRAVAAAVEALRADGKIEAKIWAYPMWFWPRRAFAHLKQPKLWKTHRRVAADAFLGAKREAMGFYRSQYESITGEDCWQVLDKDFVTQNMKPYEIFFDLSCLTTPSFQA